MDELPEPIIDNIHDILNGDTSHWKAKFRDVIQEIHSHVDLWCEMSLTSRFESEFNTTRHRWIVSKLSDRLCNLNDYETFLTISLTPDMMVHMVHRNWTK